VTTLRSPADVPYRYEPSVTFGDWMVAFAPYRVPTVGLFAQFAVLGALASTMGLGVVGWLAGGAYGVAVWALLCRALHRSGARTFGPANAVTLTRATFVGGVAAIVADTAGRAVPVAALAVLASVALLLDAADGFVARRTGSSTALGARFDMEVDAFLILVLSVFVAQFLGGWVLAIGALRYVFVAASWVMIWLRAALPVRYSRKTVAAVQGIALVVAGSGLLPGRVSGVVVALSLLALCWSFGRDVAWLWNSAQLRPLDDRLGSAADSAAGSAADDSQDVLQPAGAGAGRAR
jgi:phosphatidylglycerophosphate synthase